MPNQNQLFNLDSIINCSNCSLFLKRAIIVIINLYQFQMFRIILLGAILLISFLSNAQNGRIVGIIKDGEFNDVLPFANVVVKGSDKGATSDFEGSYELTIAPGTYILEFSFLGYQNLEITDVVVVANQTLEVNITLLPESNQLQEVILTANVARNSESSLIKAQRQSVNVMNGISAEGLQKTGAGNLATAVKSIPGVSVQGDKYVFVRGLGDRYTKTILNGVDIPGLDPDRNTLQMDIFPSNVLDNVQVIKSATADLDADFTGGMVNIVTKDFPSTKTMQFSVGTSYKPITHFNDQFLVYQHSATDFLGFDDGSRKLPISRNTNIPGPYAQDSQLTEITRAFDPELKAKSGNATPDFSLTFSMGNQKDLNGNKLGYLMAIGYKNYSDFYEDFERGNYMKNDVKSVYELDLKNIQNGNLGTRGVLLNGLFGLSYKTDRSKYSLNVMHIQNGESNAAYAHKYEYFSNTIEIFSDYLDYNQRSISNLQLAGKHTNTDATWTTEWTISPTYSSIQDKDVRYTPFEYTSSGQYAITPSGAGAPRRIWRDLTEINAVAKVDFTRKHQLFSRDSKLKFGTKATFKNRDFSIDQYFLSIYNSSGTTFGGDADAILAEENLWQVGSSEGSYVKGNYEPTNTFTAFNTNISAYVSEEFNVTEKLKSIIGLRVEKFDQYYDGQNNLGTIVLDNEKTIDHLGFFPSANLIYKLNDNTNLRASYYMATARPSFKETSIAQIYDPLTNLTYNGNLGLVPSIIQNLDLRYEWYTGDNELIAFSGFFKTFKDPIELTFYSASAPGNTQHRNIGEAMVYGGEIELRQNFDFIAEQLKKFDININFSYIQSIQEMDKSPNGEYESKLANLRDGETMKDTRTLQGQSPFLLNIGLGYKNADKGWDSNLAYNVQGKTLEIVGLGVIPDVFTLPFNSLNFNLSKSLGSDQQSSIKLQLTNLLNEQKTSVFQSYKAADQIFLQRKEGISFGLTYSYKF